MGLVERGEAYITVMSMRPTTFARADMRVLHKEPSALTRKRQFDRIEAEEGEEGVKAATSRRTHDKSGSALPNNRRKQRLRLTLFTQRDGFIRRA